MLTHPLMLANPVAWYTGPCSRFPPTPVDSSLLSTALFCPLLCSPSALFCSLVYSVLIWDLPSLILFLSRRKSRVQALCVGFAQKKNIQRDPLTGTHSYPPPYPQKRMNAQHRATKNYRKMRSNLMKGDSCEIGIRLFGKYFPVLL